MSDHFLSRLGLGSLMLTLLLLASCIQPTPPDITPGTAGGVVLPPTTGVFDYQLGGAYDRITTSEGTTRIDVVVRDADAEPLPDAYNICYVNGFQTQPDQDWSERSELLLRDDDGHSIHDPDWPDELILDPSTPEQRSGILAVIGPVIDGCAADGFDAVEIDNLDTWLRFDRIDQAGAHLLARTYVDLAHRLGLAIAQKNAAEITDTAHNELGFDFAVTEECAAWQECDAYTEVYGRHVLQIEYPDALQQAGLRFDQICAQDDRAPLTILRDRDLVPPTAPGHLRQQC